LRFYSATIFKVYNIILTLPSLIRGERFGFNHSWANFQRNVAKLSVNFNREIYFFLTETF